MIVDDLEIISEAIGYSTMHGGKVNNAFNRIEQFIAEAQEISKDKVKVCPDCKGEIFHIIQHCRGRYCEYSKVIGT